MHVPEDLNQFEWAIFADDDEPYRHKFYDQIAWFRAGTAIGLQRMTYMGGGSVDFVPRVCQDMELTKAQLHQLVPDVYSRWVAFDLRWLPAPDSSQDHRQRLSEFLCIAA